MLIQIKLAEDGKVPNKIQVLRVGTFILDDSGKHKVKITKELLFSLKKNFDENTRKYPDNKLPVDYFHESDKVASGWMEDLELSEDGTELWSNVKWTPKGAQMLADGELRYISADFHPDYLDNETGKRCGPTLMGAGLTNRPVVKGMKELVAFSESQTKNLSEGSNMNELETAQAKIKELEGVISTVKTEKEAVDKKVTELSDEIKKFSEDKAKTEKESVFTKLLSEGKVVAAQKEAYMSNDMVKFSELAQPLNTQAQGAGGEGDKNKNEKSATDQVLELARAMSKEKKINVGEAISTVLAEKPDLAKKYNEETAV